MKFRVDTRPPSCQSQACRGEGAGQRFSMTGAIRVHKDTPVITILEKMGTSDSGD